MGLREEVAKLRGLALSHRFRGEMERENRDEGNRESNDDPLDELRRAESRPLAKLGNPTFRSSPDIIAAIEFLPFSCAEVGEEGEEGPGFLVVVALVVVARLRVSGSGPLASAKMVSMCRRSPGGVVFVFTPDCSILLTEFLFVWGRSVPWAVSESLGDFSLFNSTAEGGDDDDEVAEELRRRGEDEIGSFQLRR